MDLKQDDLPTLPTTTISNKIDPKFVETNSVQVTENPKEETNACEIEKNASANELFDSTLKPDVKVSETFVEPLN